jgi:hypothetical protein
MAIKLAWTEEEVQQLMADILGDTATKLGWSVEDGDFVEPTNEVLYRFQVSDFTSFTTVAAVAELRAVVRVEAWRAAKDNTAHMHSHSVGAPGTGQTSQSDVHRFCREQYEQAVDELERKFPTSDASVEAALREATAWTVIYTNDYA